MLISTALFMGRSGFRRRPPRCVRPDQVDGVPVECGHRRHGVVVDGHRSGQGFRERQARAGNGGRDRPFPGAASERAEKIDRSGGG